MAGNPIIVSEQGKAPEIVECCGTCFFGRKVQQKGASKVTLVCKRNPPTPLLQTILLPPDVRNPGGAMGQSLTGFQSPVEPDSWCGEWTDASEPDAEAG